MFSFRVADIEQGRGKGLTSADSACVRPIDLLRTLPEERGEWAVLRGPGKKCQLSGNSVCFHFEIYR